MNREEFQEIVDRIAGKQFFSGKRRYDGEYRSRTVLIVKWETGGVSGGSCWEDSNPQPYYTNNPEPDFSDLDDILKEVCPNISFFQYKELCKNIIYGSEIDYEYYGNHTEYSKKSISVDDIWNFLTENALVG